MSRAGGGFFGQYGGDKLAFAVEIEWTFDLDQHIVGRTEANRAAPHNATALPFNDFAHGGHIKPYRRQCFHRVGGSCRGCNRAR